MTKKNMVYFQDPLRYLVKIRWISRETVLPLLELLDHLEDWAFRIKDMTCEFYSLQPLENNIIDVVGGQQLSKVNAEYIVSAYRKRRVVVVANISSTVGLITNEYREILLVSALQSRVQNGTYRNVCELKLNVDGSWLGFIYPCCTSKHQPQSTNTSVVLPLEFARIGTQCLPERPSHHTTPVPPTVMNTIRLSKSEIFGKKKNPNLDYVYPLANPFQYDRPRYSTEKYSVQASDADPSVDCYRSSFVPSMPLVAGTLSRSNNSKTEIVTNVSSFRREFSPVTSGHDDNRRYGDASNENSSHSQAFQPHNNVQPRNMQSPRHPNFASLNARVESYLTHSWNETTRPRRNDLANSGLFATGNGDLARCFQCGLGLKDWVRDDDPLEEHVKYSTECSFLMQKLGIDGLRRFKDAVNPSATDEALTTQTPANASSATRNTSLPYPVRHLRYMSVEDRLASFIGFPPQVTQSHRELAVAGLFFTGEGDICRCFTCDGGLKNWVPGDDPMEEHAKFFPQCPYLRHIKGDHFVELVRQRKHGRNEVVPNPSTSVFSPMPRSSPSQVQVTSTAQAFGQLSVSGITGQEATEILRTPAAKSVLEMGYSEDVVKRAINQLVVRGQKTPSAQQIMELILDYEDSGEIPSFTERHLVSGAADINNGEMDVMSENERLKAMMKCINCKTAERNILCIPCSHHRMCEDCATDVTHCPACGRYLEQKIKTFMS